MEYASRGVANGGLTTGIIGTSLGALNLLGGLAGGTVNMCPRPAAEFVTKDELRMAQELSGKDAEIALLKADNDTDKKLVDVYAKLETRDKELRQEIAAFKEMQYGINAAQGVTNAQVAANIAVDQQAIAEIKTVLGGITKTVVPITAVCPEPMPAKNSWTAPTATT